MRNDFKEIPDANEAKTGSCESKLRRRGNSGEYIYMVEQRKWVSGCPKAESEDVEGKGTRTGRPCG